ncbi:MAG: DUF1223 domain-containing protein [Rhodocyclales bacterium]|nr:DUF1223 domain-containing protein [Rhodocyclales bacterium]
MFVRLLLAAAVLCATPLSSPQAGQADACSRSSPRHTVALVELFTSEGCSSCPPADRWLEALPTRHAPDRLLPLALHVDYWDYIGWQDPYAQAQFAERQRLLGRLSRSSSIYTPGVFAGMRELRDWRDPAALDRRVQEINRQPARVGISLAMRPAGPRRIEIEAQFTPQESAVAARHLRAVLVLYENRLVSVVHRGENRGATLHHDHVVRYWSIAGLGGGTEQQKVARAVVLPPEWKAAQLGVAAFVEDTERGEVLQAVSMPACPNVLPIE